MKFQLIHHETFHEVGNRLTKTEGAQQTSYTYNNMNQLTNDGTFAYTYDDNGNLIQKADGYNTFIYTYDYENRMTEVKWNGQTLQENFYDCCGKRIKSINYDNEGQLLTTKIFIYIGWSILYEKTIYPDDTVTEEKYIYGPSGHLAKLYKTISVEVTTYYHTDHLGSVRQLTNANGDTIWASYAIYKPFGGLYSGGPSDESETHLYTGKTYDYGTGLYYYGARFYDPEVGRFISKDSYTFLPNDSRVIGLVGNSNLMKENLGKWLLDSQNFNGYIYVKNNPLKFYDIDGHQPTLSDFLEAYLGYLAIVLGVVAIAAKLPLLGILSIIIGIILLILSFMDLLDTGGAEIIDWDGDGDTEYVWEETFGNITTVKVQEELYVTIYLYIDGNLTMMWRNWGDGWLIWIPDSNYPEGGYWAPDHDRDGIPAGDDPDDENPKCPPKC